MGRNRVPESIKLVRGTFRPDRANRQKPRPAPGVSAPRRSLPVGVRFHFRRLVRLCQPDGTLGRPDVVLVEQTARALDECEACERVITERGRTYEAVTEAGSVMIRVRPEVPMAADAWRRALAGLVQLGLSPVAREKVKVRTVETADPLAAFTARRTPGA